MGTGRLVPSFLGATWPTGATWPDTASDFATAGLGGDAAALPGTLPPDSISQAIET